ncbi:9462_t:CDS:2, partial [Entrophospora sp. SA101]
QSAKLSISLAGHIPLTDLILIEKAKTFAKMLNIPDDTLSFSTGWFQSFKNRNNLKRYQLHGESGLADISAIENAIPDLKTVIRTFKSEDVYNMDETGLGVVYRANGKAQMTAVLFQEMNGRRVLLLLDNAPCHIVRGMELQNTQEENNDENQNEEEDSDEESELPAIPIKERLEALEKVMTCLLQQHKDCPDEIKKLT